jgi:phosphonate dehydrogenase
MRERSTEHERKRCSRHVPRLVAAVRGNESKARLSTRVVLPRTPAGAKGTDVSRAVVVIAQPVHADAVAELASRCEVRCDPDQVGSPDVEALLVTMADRVDRGMLERYPRLRVVSGALKGPDNIDVDECTRRGVLVTVEPHLLTEPTAELAVALLLAVARRVREGDALVRNGDFTGWRPQLYGLGLTGTAVGIVGMGAVGRSVAMRLRPFGCKLSYTDPGVPAIAGLTAMPLDELLASSLAVVMAVPLTPHTRGLLDERRLSLMPTGSMLINIGRGSTVDETAVGHHLETGHLAGYGADVFEVEDRFAGQTTIPRALLEHPRSVFAPHLGSAIESVRREIELRAALRITAVLDGRRPAGAINLAEGA